MALYKGSHWLGRIRRAGLLGSILALLSVGGSETVAAQASTFVLNTGLVGRAGANLIPQFGADDDWNIIVDPVIPGLPRPAVAVAYLGSNFKWPAPFANSKWVAGIGDNYANSSLSGRPSFTYQTCFTLPFFFNAPTLKLQARADDIVRRIRFNGAVVFEDPDPNAKAGATKAGSHRGPPLALTLTTGFQLGRNCLDVVVEDTDNLISGLNVAATVTFTRIPPSGATVAFCLPGTVGQIDLSTGTTNGVKNAPGIADPKWNLVVVPTGFPGSAFSTNTVPNWVANTPQPGNWIQRMANTNPQADSAGSYSYQMQLPPLNPALYSSIQLSMRYAADNTANVYFNGQQVASCAGPNCFSSWRTVPTLGTPATTFLPNNTLAVVVGNSGSVTGLIVDASLRWTCQ
jgi:hypothetical protein